MTMRCGVLSCTWPMVMAALSRWPAHHSRVICGQKTPLVGQYIARGVVWCMVYGMVPVCGFGVNKKKMVFTE